MRLSIVMKQLMFRSGTVLLIKLLGAVVRFPMFRLMGAEGVGLYQMVYSIYGLFLTAVSGGIPTAVALATAKDVNQGARMFRLSIGIIALMGGAAGFLTHRFAPLISAFFGNSELEWAVKTLAPVLIIVPLLSVIRGFLQGIEYYGYIAISELTEQVLRLTCLFVLVTLWMRDGIGAAVSGAVVGAFVGALGALIYLAVILLFFIPRTKRLPIRYPIFMLLVDTSLAITASRSIMPLSEFLDAYIIPHRLQDSGLDVATATSVFGEFTGMAASIVYLPNLLTYALSFIMITKLTQDWKKHDIARFSNRSRAMMQAGWLWGLGSAWFLYWYRAPLSQILYHNGDAALAIGMLCLAPLIAGMRELTATVLWGQDDRRNSAAGLLIGLVCSIACGYYLIAKPDFRYIGTAVQLLSFEFVSLVWNMEILRKRGGMFITLQTTVYESMLLSAVTVLLFYTSHLCISSILAPGFLQLVSETALSFLCYSCYVYFRIIRFPGTNLRTTHERR